MITATIAAIKAADFGKAEVEVTGASAPVYRISNEQGGYQKVESRSFLVFPSVMEEILKDPSICDDAADIAEFIACIGRDAEVRELSMISTGAQIEFDLTEDHRDHDFIRPEFHKVVIAQRAKERVSKAIDKYGEL